MFEDEGISAEQVQYELSVRRSKRIIKIVRFAFVIIVLPLMVLGFALNTLWFYPAMFVFLQLTVIYFIHKNNIK